jgi:hypothetical protein
MLVNRSIARTGPNDITSGSFPPHNLADGKQLRMDCRAYQTNDDYVGVGAGGCSMQRFGERGATIWTE